MKAFFLVAVLVLLGPGQAMVQDSPDGERFFPRRGFMLSGSGTAGYNAVFADGTLPNNFSAIFAPIVLYQISDRFLFEREFEYKFEGGVTATARETSEVVPLLSVELVSFEARVDGPDVLLSWATASETINAGFEIQWHSKNAGADQQMAQEWQLAGWVNGHGTTERPRSYTYRVTGLAPGRHVFSLKQINFDDTFAYSPEVEAVVKMVDRFLIEPVYPNPFNPQAQFRFAVHRSQAVRVDLYDLLGRRVKVLYEGEPSGGQMHTVRIDAVNHSRTSLLNLPHDEPKGRAL